MERRLNLYAFPAIALFGLSAGCGGGSSSSATMPPPPTDPDAAVVALKTATPIKHVIIIVGENRSFDHIFATYVPKTAGESVLNLLSQHILNADGTPGPNFAQAYQYQITSAPNGGKYFSSADLRDKSLYATLPPPDVGDVPAVSPDTNILNTPGGDPELSPGDQYLLGTGGTGLSYTLGPDTRISNVMSLPPGPFQLTGPDMPFDAFTADTSHGFFQMWQQVDCAVDAEHVSASNPTGCLHDLQSAVTTTYDTPPGSTPHDTGQTMAFFNMQQGDAPLFKYLADEYTISDNYHQPDMGGTGNNSLPLAFADQIFYSDGVGHPATPPAITIFNPDPLAGTLNFYSYLAEWVNCSDPTQPGVAPILNYLKSLPYAVDPHCGPGQYWQVVNISPALGPKGTATGGYTMPSTMQRSIGDLLDAHNIPWKYYGGTFDAQGTGGPLDGDFCTICNPFEFEASYPSLIADHMRDVLELFTDLKNGTLPAVAYVKPDGLLDGHPRSSKLTLFEAFVKNIVTLAQSNQVQWSRTAILITVDEGGGFYDSGFIQPVDFFGTGPRIPLVAVSPFATGGHVSHVYGEHSSFVKFVERNWELGETLSTRSRDNLPNPQPGGPTPYVPGNMPAIGDLFDLFHFE